TDHTSRRESFARLIFAPRSRGARDKLPSVIDRTRNQDEYRASARRLRYRFRNSPVMKLSSLRTLAFAHDLRERVQAQQVAVPHRIRDFTTRITCELAT